MKAIVVLLLGTLIVGCQQGFVSDTPASTLTNAPTTQATSAIDPTATVEPTPEPTVDVRQAAADAYLAAVTTLNAGLKVASPFCAKNTLSSQTKCLSRVFNALEAFDLTVRAIEFPEDTQADVHDMLRIDASYDALVRQAYGSNSLRQILDYYWPKILAANQASSEASNLIRGDLRLPPVPSKL